VICDADVVEVTNLNRQAFYRTDLYKPKALCLARHVANQSLLTCTVTGHQVDFDATSAELLCPDVTLAFVGVDNNQTRAFASRFFRKRNIPAIFASVNTNADYGWVFVQRPDHDACLGCVFPELMERAEREPRRCSASPAAIDILQALGALTLYAIDSLLMPGRHSKWTLRTMNLVCGANDVSAIAQLNPNCPLCTQ
jgi:molybdopterin/thiamine biosynthesis adenylyltransferase